jgi:hypothetical protein
VLFLTIGTEVEPEDLNIDYYGLLEVRRTGILSSYVSPLPS